MEEACALVLADRQLRGGARHVAHACRISRERRALGGVDEQLQRRLRLDVRQLPRAREEDLERRRRRAVLELGDPANPGGLGACARVVADRGRLLGERHRVVVPAGHARRDGRRDEAAPARRRIGGQLGGALVRTRRRGMTPAGARTRRRVVELAQDVLVRVERSGGAMPGAAVGLVHAERVGQRAVRGASLVRRRALVDRRTHQGVVELEPGAAHGHQTRLLGRVEGRPVGSQRFRGLQDGREPAGVVRGGDEQQPLCRLRQPPHTVEEDPLDPLRQRQRRRQRLRAGELRRAERTRNLEQGERVAPGVLDELVAHVRRDLHRSRAARAAARPRRTPRPPSSSTGRSGASKRRDPVVARREQQHDPLRVEPARDEEQRVRGRCIEPVRVVDQGEYRSSLRERRQQLQDGDRDEEAVIPGPVAEAECAAQGSLLRRRQRIQIVERGPNELMQRGERQLRLGLHAPRADDAHVCRPLARVLEQGRLADPRLAAESEDAAPRRARPVEQLADPRALLVAAVEHRAMIRQRLDPEEGVRPRMA